ncbi:MAG: TonB-dependent receptor [Verrucomicrobia bacterium]|nr:TonB-dependent receptor [Verrucomicrobiota bacterium]
MNLTSLRTLVHAGRRAFRAISLFAAFAIVSDVSAQSATGAIEGRVQSETSGSYLTNARVRVTGTTLEAFTNSFGEFRLAGVPAGPAALEVFHTGLATKKLSVNVRTGDTVQQDVVLREFGEPGREGDTVLLRQFVVQSQRETDAAAIAINEQRFAPNRKDVVSTDQFGDINTGNIGEFVKFIPGISLDVKDGNSPSGIMIRGFDPNYTNVTMDGGQLASTLIANTQTSSRGFLLEQANINNLSRIEVTKLPTPDMSANLLGGAVNFVSKSAFERPKQQLTFNVFLSANSKALGLGQTAGPGEDKSYKVLPNFDLTYVNPVSKTFGIVLNVAQSTQFYLQNKAVFGRRYFTGTNATTANFVSYQKNPQTTSLAYTFNPNRIERTSGSIKLDWKPLPRHVLEFSAQANANYQQFSNRTITFNTGGTIPVRWDEHNTFGSTGAAGTGSVSLGNSFQNRNGLLRQLGTRWTYNGTDWLTELAASYSNSNNRVRDMAKGFWNGLGTSMPNVRTVNLEGFDNSTAWVNKITVLDATGREMDPYHLSSFALGQVQSQPADSHDTVKEVRGNVTRKLNLAGVAVNLKVGGTVNEMTRDAKYSLWTTTFAGPDGILGNGDEFMVSNQVNFIDSTVSGVSPGFGVRGPEWASPWLIARALKDRPSWFVRSATNMGDTIRNEAVRSPWLRETITAGYAMADAKLLNNRLRLVGGVRYELTKDEGLGYKQDANAIYVKDAAGHPVKGANGQYQLLPSLAGTVTGGPEQNALIYRYRQSPGERDYAYYFPSLHATYNVSDNLLVRAAVAKTMGRPNISDVVPNLFVQDNVNFGIAGNSSATVPGFVTASNSTLRPWRAMNYDYSLEYYLPKNGLASFNWYKKDIRDFFSTQTTIADAALLDSLGLSREFVGYQYSTRINISDAMIKGWEANFNLPLANLASLGALASADRYLRPLTLTLNTTHLELSGSRITPTDWKRYIPRTRNAGLRFAWGKLSGNFLLNWRGRMQRDTATLINGLSTGGAEYIRARYQLDGNVDFQLTKHFALYLSGRNILNADSEWEVAGPGAVDYAAKTNFENYGAQFSVGIRGTF